MSIMVVGTEVSGEFSFANLADTISEKGGVLLGSMFGVGLMAAGLSSSITSPLAAAITAKSTFNDERNLWDEKGIRFKAVWMVIMLIGLVLGLSGLKVVPVIIAAQAINGFLLPVIACYLLIIVNRRDLLGEHSNGVLLNIISLLIIGICFFVGMNNVFSAAGKVFGHPEWANLNYLKMIVSFVGVVLMSMLVFKPSAKNRPKKT